MEEAGRRIKTKIDLAQRLVEALGSAARPPASGRAVLPDAGEDAATLLGEIEGLRAQVAMCEAVLLFEPELALDRVEARRRLFEEAAPALGKLDSVVSRALRAAGPAPPKKPRRGEGRLERTRRELGRLAAAYREYSCEAAAPDFGARVVTCEQCGVEMSVHPDLSELSCPECGGTRELVGAVFDDAQFFNQEGQKAKSGAYNPCRHFRQWMDHILAREPDEEIGDKNDPTNLRGEKLVAEMRGLARRDRKIVRLLTVYDVRAMLSELGRTDLNQNAALLLKRLTGVGPPDISEELYFGVEKDFVRVVAYDNELRPAGTNRNHYPYFIYKLYDARLARGDYENRRVLYYIFLQKQDTLDKNEQEWLPIHEAFPDIHWRPIIRSEALRYRPRS